jgi:hypothetical protein
MLPRCELPWSLQSLETRAGMLWNSPRWESAQGMFASSLLTLQAVIPSNIQEVAVDRWPWIE